MKTALLHFQQSLVTLARIILQSRWRGILKSEFTNPKASCLILGNGPSLNATIEQYADQFERFDLVAVNSFASSQYYTQLEPRFYIINASIVFLPDDQLTPLYQNLKHSMLGSIAEKTTWEMELMVPFVAQKSEYFQNLLKQNKHIRPLYFNYQSIEGFTGLKRFFFRKGLGTPRPHNVIIPAIMNCIYLKYKTIALVGADHSWLKEISVSDENVALVNQKHFYDENESKAAPMSDYQIRPRRLHEMLLKFMLSFKGYWEINEYIEGSDIHIYNCSETSMIDAFERKKLTEI
jgi:hypothetical protein